MMSGRFFNDFNEEYDMILGTCTTNSWILKVGVWYNQPTRIEIYKGRAVGSEKRFRR